MASVSIGGSVAQTPGLREAMEYESERLGLPIRVRRPAGQVEASLARGWTHTQAGRAGVSLEEARTTGITLAIWATIGMSGTRFTLELPEPLTDVGSIEVEDSFTIESPGEMAETFEVGGVVLGEVTDRVVALHFNPSFLPPDVNVQWSFLSSVFDGCVDPDLAERFREQRDEASRVRFVELLSQRSTSDQTLRTEIRDLTDTLQERQSHVNTTQQRLRDKQELLDAVISSRLTGEELLASLDAEWEAIKRHAHVVDVTWSGSKLIIRTDELTITRPDTDETAPLGEFAITICPEDRDITVRNLTNRRGTYDHPHVNRGGFCTGSAANTIDQLLQNMQLAALVNLLLSLLSHVTPEDDWGRHVEWWFQGEGAPEASGEILDRDERDEAIRTAVRDR